MLYISDTDTVSVVWIPTCEAVQMDAVYTTVCLALHNMTTHTDTTYQITPSQVSQVGVCVAIPAQPCGQYNFTLSYKGEVYGRGLMQSGSTDNTKAFEYERQNTVTVYEPTEETDDDE